MKRGIVAGLAGLALVVVSCAGCSSKSEKAAQSSAPQGTAPSGPVVIVDGQNLKVTGAVTCTPSGNNINIGIGDASAGIGAVVSKDTPPIVHAVGLGAVNGVTLGFSDAAPNQATNAGAAVKDKTYAIKGTASGVDVSNPQDPKSVTKPFEMSVTCP
ncbi:lipoprotein LpqH [Mycobacterium vicinigordonae]|uniref:Lipoprotein LpqH n=1 Tax=Mycobacterium vicinigordonae TaxID=1719132 RepID=A0A7D6I6L1_9MYCO|nr:lipoprotein LpqH [Mycobacterium vicinigordonae]QLL06956.1 lipoprotein LpqH [Mycobacterium vicinigordonae]